MKYRNRTEIVWNILVDRILEKPVFLDRLKKEVQELISTINIRKKFYNKRK